MKGVYHGLCGGRRLRSVFVKRVERHFDSGPFNSQNAVFQFAASRGSVQVAFESLRIDDPHAWYTESQHFADFLSQTLGLVFRRQNLDPDEGWRGEDRFGWSLAEDHANVRDQIPLIANPDAHF